MTVQDWGATERWLIEARNGVQLGLQMPWWVYRPFAEDGECYATYAEARAAYLDAVTCEAQTPFPNYTEPRCTRARGHKDGHWFIGKNGLTDLEQMPK